MTDPTPAQQIPPDEDNSELEDTSGAPEPEEEVGPTPEGTEDL